MVDYGNVNIMETKFENYKIHIDDSNNYPDKFVASIEELYNVICLVDSKEQASEKLEPLFNKEIMRLTGNGQPIPKPGTGKANITFVANDNIENLRPFVDEFWDKVLETSYTTSYVSDDSYFSSWERYFDEGKDELIKKVIKIYSVDISSFYDKPIHEILKMIKNLK